MTLTKLLDFPPELLGLFICSWLNIRSIVRLDSSVCNKTERPIFLDLLESDNFVLPKLSANEPTNRALLWAINRLVKCKTLGLNPHVQLNILDDYLSKQRNFEHLHMRKLNDTFCVCFMISSHCRALCSIFFNGCALSKSVRNIFLYCTSLREVFFHYCTCLSFDMFQGVSSPSLETLALTDCRCDDQCMLAAVSMSKNIVNLNLSGNLLTDGAVRRAAASLTHLYRLGISGLIHVSDTTITQIAVACGRLHAIDLTLCDNISDAAVVFLVTNCKQLEHLVLPGDVSFTVLSAIAQNCPGLKRLIAGELVGVSLQDEILLLESCQQLHTLGMSFSCPESAQHIPASVRVLELVASDLSDELLVAISRRCKHLSTLNVWFDNPDSRAYTSKGLAAIAKGCTNLRELLLDNDAAQVTALALDLWRNTCPNLVVFNSPKAWYSIIFAPAGYC